MKDAHSGSLVSAHGVRATSLRHSAERCRLRLTEIGRGRLSDASQREVLSWRLSARLFELSGFLRDTNEDVVVRREVVLHARVLPGEEHCDAVLAGQQ